MQGQKSYERSAETQVYAGIDVCKDWLDVYIHPIGRKFRVPNTPEATNPLSVRSRQCRALRSSWRRPPNTIVNPFRARLFAEAFGQLAKTHKLDTRLLAMMAECLKPEARPPAPKEFDAGQEIVHARSAAIADRTTLSNRRLASQTAFLKVEIGRRLTALAKPIDRLDAEIERRLEADPAFKRRYDILISIPGAGPVAAIALVAGLPELGACSG